MLDGVAQAIPPGRPLSEIERGMIAPPLAEVIYVYGGEIDPALGLALVLGVVAFGRWTEYRAARSSLGATSSAPPPTAAESTVTIG